MQAELITIKEHAERLVHEHRMRARLEERLAVLRQHQQELADQHRIVTVVISEMEALLKAPEKEGAP